MNHNEIKVDVTTDIDEQTTKGKSKQHVKNCSVKSSETIENGLKTGKDDIILKTQRSKSLADPTNLTEFQFNSIQNRVVSIVSLNDLGGEVMLNRRDSVQSPENGFWYTKCDILSNEKKIIKDLKFNLQAENG